ncbi:serine/threonine-protein phosphatase CPPED1-like [Oppia nitens]|uniref:serine/threonine-protein phosphatase CPPED1-like n=1 Tax=Oppia nitens TaxID=1686743 RepID=UPI0023DC030B|nr:serine/threonine-protein phosphatase CPPED1-like [Oppia nitens]
MSQTIDFKIQAVNQSFGAFKSAEEQEWKEPFVFIQSADTQLGLIDDYFKNPNPNWNKEIQLTRDAIRAANQMQPKPKFFIVCGDLVNAMPGHADRLPQIVDFKKCFQDLNNDIPLVCVCGNHDVGDNPTVDTVKDYRREFGDDYFAFVCSGVMFVVLNSQYFKDITHVGDLAEQQSKWLDTVLEEYRRNSSYKHLVVFQHIPWFLEKADEDDNYFNVDKELRLKMLDKLYEAGVRYIFTGHYHRNAGGMYKDMELVVTSAIGAQLGTDRSGLRVVRVYDKSIQHKYYAIEDIPKQIVF